MLTAPNKPLQRTVRKRADAVLKRYISGKSQWLLLAERGTLVYPDAEGLRSLCGRANALAVGNSAFFDTGESHARYKKT
jgi:hypothetical protein